MISSLLFVLALAQAEPAASGKRLFDGQCAVCHGIGGGGSTGPSLQRPVLPRAATDEDLVQVIQQGLPGTQMPAAWTMSDHEAQLVAAYVRSLGKVEQTPLTGDPKRGEDLYKKAGCVNCHIIRGMGRGFGPELTTIGLRRAPTHLKQSLTDPAADVAPEFLTMRLVTKENREIKAFRVNEDSFTIQIKDSSLRYQSFQKRDLLKVERLFSESLMPSYKTRLQPSQLDDLVAYLAGLR
jgi:putative heme-binding domain-containing protein